MPKADRGGFQQVNITLPDWMIERLDQWQDEVCRNRSAVVADMIRRRIAIEEAGTAALGATR